MEGSLIYGDISQVIYSRELPVFIMLHPDCLFQISGFNMEYVIGY